MTEPAIPHYLPRFDLERHEDDASCFCQPERTVFRPGHWYWQHWADLPAEVAWNAPLHPDEDVRL